VRLYKEDHRYIRMSV